MPSIAPGNKTELTANTIISKNKSTIITLTMRSTPFSSPNAQMPKEKTTTPIIHPTVMAGLAVTPAKTWATPSVERPAKLFESIKKK